MLNLFFLTENLRGIFKKLRSQKFLKQQVYLLKFASSVLILESCITMLIIEEFHNALLRICFTLMTAMFNIYSEYHYVLRMIAIVINILMIMVIENAYQREALMILVCNDLGLCKMKTSFEQLNYLRTIDLIDGHLLRKGESDYTTMQVHYWRSITSVLLHYLSIIILFQLSKTLGFVSNKQLSFKFDDILDRPNEDKVDIFQKLKLPSY